jgi:hypothetical protein
MSERRRDPRSEKQKISLVLADVDGTLVTEEKVLTKRARAAGGGRQPASGRPRKRTQIQACGACREVPCMDGARDARGI